MLKSIIFIIMKLWGAVIVAGFLTWLATYVIEPFTRNKTEVNKKVLAAREKGLDVGCMGSLLGFFALLITLMVALAYDGLFGTKPEIPLPEKVCARVCPTNESSPVIVHGYEGESWWAGDCRCSYIISPSDRECVPSDYAEESDNAR